MHFDKIIIKRKNINAQDKAETFFFYMASWFLSEMRTLQDIYICSMNTKDASGLEVYGRNYRTMTIGCILCAKLWEGWQILQNCYFSQEMHKQFESLYSNEGKASLVALKKYFANGKKTIVYKIRNSTFHYPKTEDEKNKLERRCNDTDENDYSEHFIAENCHNSLFSTDHFVANFVDKTNSKNVRESIKALNLDVKMLTKHFYQFLSEYILCFQKKCTFSKEQIHLENVPAMKDVYLPFFTE